MDISSWKAQLRKGAAELAVLFVIGRAERYGLEILESLEGQRTIEISEGTIYPLLNRLEREGKLKSRWVQPRTTGNPRKYYALTPDGRELLKLMLAEWADFSGALNRLLNGKSK